MTASGAEQGAAGPGLELAQGAGGPGATVTALELAQGAGSSAPAPGLNPLPAAPPRGWSSEGWYSSMSGVAQQ